MPSLVQKRTLNENELAELEQLERRIAHREEANAELKRRLRQLRDRARKRDERARMKS